MEESDVGTLILRVHGDAAGPNDLRILMQAIVSSEHLRSRCKSIGNLTKDIPERERQDYAEMCLHILYAWAPPKEDIPIGEGQLAYALVVSSMAISPMKGTIWADHIGKGYISAYLCDVLVALEGLWGVPGHLAKKD